jgi:hypothetical protein
MTIFPAALVLAGGAFLSSCEDSPLTAGADYTMTLIAQPQAVLVNPAAGIDSGTSTLIATVLNADSVPQSGITVFFSNEGGTLASGANGVKTNGSGVAIDTLTVTADDPATFDVTATSASLTESVTITRTTVATNHPPVAGIIASPDGQQAVGEQVIFDGSGSSDPDEDDIITMYKWIITSTNGDAGEPNPIVAEGPGVSGISFPSDLRDAFENVQNLNVTLMVTDDPAAPETFADGGVVAYRSQTTIPYQIVAVSCDANDAPTAVIAGGSTQQVFGGSGSTQSFQLDGSLSTDPETPIETYTWNCGNGSLPLEGAGPGKAICRYFVDGVPRTYTATLVVTDRGTGTLSGGQYECAKSSTAATVQVVVSPLAGG